MTNNLKTYLGVLSAVLLWGASWLAVKTGLMELSSQNLALLRLIMAAAMFFILLRCFYPGQTIDKSDWLYTWAIGTFGVGGYFMIQSLGLKYTTTVNSSIIVGASPILVTLMSAKLFHQEELTLAKLLGSLVGFLGIFLIFSGGEGLTLGSATLKGDLIMLVTSLTWALFSISSKRLVDKYDPFVAVAYTYIFGALTFFPLILRPQFLYSVAAMSVKGWMAMFYLAAFCSVYAFFFWYRGIQILGASRTAMFNYINPLVAVLIGVLFLKEPGDIYTFLGGLAIFGGVYIASYDKGKPKIEAKT